MLALQYAGSRALKTDFTRTGKRTLTGAMCDLKNALVRYYHNNFCDGRRQDGVDLMLGNVSPEKALFTASEPSVTDGKIFRHEFKT